MVKMKGQSLIEVLVALGIISLVVTAIATIVTSSLSNAQFGSDQTSANRYASEGMEVVRSIRDDDYTAFTKYKDTYCLNKGQNILVPDQAPCTTPNVDKFIRSVLIEQAGCGGNVAKTTVTVSWTDGKCQSGTYCHKAFLESCLSTIEQVQAP